MAESLWLAGDDYLATQVLAALGASGDYTTLIIKDVHKWAQFDVPDFKDILLPASIIVSYDSAARPAGHDGSATIKRENTYYYALVSVVEGTKQDATRDAKILAWRQEALLSTLRFQGVTADDGSKIGRVISTRDSNMFRTNVALWSKPTSKSDSVYGLAITAFALTGVTA